MARCVEAPGVATVEGTHCCPHGGVEEVERSDGAADVGERFDADQRGSVVFPVAGTGVVRRVDVDAVDLAGVGELQQFEGVVVLGVDDGVCRLVAAAVHRFEVFEAGVDGFAELGDDDEVADGELGRMVVGRVVVGAYRYELGDAAFHGADEEHLTLVVSAGHANTATDRVRGQRDALGEVRFEHQAEGPLGSDLVEAAAEVVSECRVVDSGE